MTPYISNRIRTRENSIGRDSRPGTPGYVTKYWNSVCISFKWKNPWGLEFKQTLLSTLSLGNLNREVLIPSFSAGRYRPFFPILKLWQKNIIKMFFNWTNTLSRVYWNSIAVRTFIYLFNQRLLFNICFGSNTFFTIKIKIPQI